MTTPAGNTHAPQTGQTSDTDVIGARRLQAQALLNARLLAEPDLLTPMSGAQTQQRLHELYLRQTELELEIAALRSTHAHLIQNTTQQPIDLSDIANFIAERFPSKVTYWKADLRCGYANHEVMGWFGRTQEEMLTIHLHDFLGPELFQKNIAYIQGALKGMDQQFERTLVSVNGETTHNWVQYLVHRIDGVVLGFFALVTDVTLLKRAQIALLNSEAKNRALLRAIPDLILSLQRDGTCLEVHSSMRQAMPLAASELLQRRLTAILPADVAARFMQAIEEALTSGKVQEVPYTLHAPNEEESHFAARIAPATSDTVICIVRDVSELERERRQRELLLSDRLQVSQQDLHQAQQNLSLASDAAGLGIWIRDIASDEVWASPEWRKLFGFSADEALNSARIFEHIHPADRYAILQMRLENEIHKRQKTQADMRIVLPDGQVRWVAAVSQMELDAGGKPRLSRGVAVDITATKRAALELEQKRMEVTHLARVATLGELSGALAHEMNQPLTAILSNAQAALRFLQREQPDLDEVREILQDIVEADQRAGEVIRRLRRLFGKQVNLQQHVDINALAREVQHLLHNDLINRGVTLVMEVASDNPCVLADPVQLQQVLINLIINAADASAALDENARHIVLRSSVGGDGDVLLTVSDAGSGIAPEKMEKIFTPFYTTKEHGMGLGLSICKNIVEANGGRLWCENNPDRGVSFYCRLPMCSQEAS
ncbi:MAG: PAS domain-containing protein [Burkholderiales bacterium]|nr:PAS domain-containing protein [Burkholderiales bacterium]